VRWAGFFSYGRGAPLPGFPVRLNYPEGKKVKSGRKEKCPLALPDISEFNEDAEV